MSIKLKKANLLPPTTNVSIFEIMKINPQTDSYKISGGAGVAVAHVKKTTGEIVSVYARANGAFKQMTRFNPSDLSISERRNLELDLHKDGWTQNEIADFLGVSQATVCLDLKQLRENE